MTVWEGGNDGMGSGNDGAGCGSALDGVWTRAIQPFTILAYNAKGGFLKWR